MGSSSFYNGNAADYATLDPSTVTASAAAAAASAVAAQASATSASTSLSTLVSTLASYVTSTALTTILSGYATGGSLAAYAPLASPALTGTPTAPTAPLGTNNTQIATTAFVLANSAPPGREKLTGNRTYYVRPDGSNSNTGLVDSAAGAFLTWNAAYIAVASKIDFAGFTVTISGGASAATFSAGLLIDFAWTGGGSLIIDLRGSSISETVTKGILINEVLPGLVTIQNKIGRAHV